MINLQIICYNNSKNHVTTAQKCNDNLQDLSLLFKTLSTYANNTNVDTRNFAEINIVIVSSSTIDSS